MDHERIKVFNYKRINAVFEVKFKEIGITKKEQVDTINVTKEQKEKIQKTINVKANYYEVSNLF